jgi:hypothetical protein
MKKTIGIITLFVMLASLQMRADDSIMVAPRPNILESMPGVEVIQDSAVALLLDGVMNGSKEWVEVDGYRVQIYSSNQQQYAKSEALDLEAKLQDHVSHTIYVQYISPFWKVRIGDFRSYEDAKEYKRLFVQQYPTMVGDTYIVRDKIKVLQ